MFNSAEKPEELLPLQLLPVETAFCISPHLLDSPGPLQSELKSSPFPPAWSFLSPFANV